MYPVGLVALYGSPGVPGIEVLYGMREEELDSGRGLVGVSESDEV